jgi:hypothetical protein
MLRMTPSPAAREKDSRAAVAALLAHGPPVRTRATKEMRTGRSALPYSFPSLNNRIEFVRPILMRSDSLIDAVSNQLAA